MIDLFQVMNMVEQANTLAYYTESALEEDDCSKTAESRDRLAHMVYALVDKLKEIGPALEEVNGHIQVCNAVFAAAHVREMQKELEELRKRVKTA